MRAPFNSLPLGTAFRFVDAGYLGVDVWIALETHGIGKVAAYQEPGQATTRQSLCCFKDEDHPMDTLVEVVPLATLTARNEASLIQAAEAAYQSCTDDQYSPDGIKAVIAVAEAWFRSRLQPKPPYEQACEMGENEFQGKRITGEFEEAHGGRSKYMAGPSDAPDK